MKRPLSVLALALGIALAPPLWAEISGNNGISVTSTSATTSFTTPMSSLRLINDSASANELYARVFRCGETSGAATTSSPIRLEPGESVGFTYSGTTEKVGGIQVNGYCATSYITAAGETAILRLIAK